MSSSDSSAATETAPVRSDVDEFCAAWEALDQTDGTTEATIALQAIEEVRRTVPAEVRDDFILVSDDLIVKNYPRGVQPSMDEASFEELDPAGTRLGAYVDEHCDLAPE